MNNKIVNTDISYEYFPYSRSWSSFSSIWRQRHTQNLATTTYAHRGGGNDLHNPLTELDEFKQRLLDDWKAGKTGLKGRVAELTRT